MMFNPLDLTDRVVLVTGASSGIGRSSAVTLSRLGARVVLSGRRQEALQETLGQMEDPDRHWVDPFDLADIDGIPAWMKSIVAKVGGPLAGVVHSAGMMTPLPLRVVNKQNTDQLLLPNVYSTLALLRGITSKGVAREGTSVVLLSSVASLIGSPGLTTYAGSKGAINSIVRSAAKELGGKRIRVNGVAPGYVETPMFQELRETVGEGLRELEERHFMGIAKPEEVAVAIAYLLSDAARTVTGTMLKIDGGYTC